MTRFKAYEAAANLLRSLHDASSEEMGFGGGGVETDGIPLKRPQPEASDAVIIPFPKLWRGGT